MNNDRVRFTFFGQVAEKRQAVHLRKPSQPMFSRRQLTKRRKLAPALVTLHAEPYGPLLQSSECRNRTMPESARRASPKNGKRTRLRNRRLTCLTEPAELSAHSYAILAPGSESPQTPFNPGTAGDRVRCARRKKCFTPNKQSAGCAVRTRSSVRGVAGLVDAAYWVKVSANAIPCRAVGKRETADRDTRANA